MSEEKKEIETIMVFGKEYKVKDLSEDQKLIFVDMQSIEQEMQPLQNRFNKLARDHKFREEQWNALLGKDKEDDGNTDDS